jgi:DNA-binding cell septation regulator SpoVG
MTISRLFILESPAGNTKAFVDLETNEGIILKGFKLILGPTGLFLGAPSEKGKDGKWRESIIIPKEMKTEINSMAISEYDRIRTSTPTSSAIEPEEEAADLPF